MSVEKGFYLIYCETDIWLVVFNRMEDSCIIMVFDVIVFAFLKNNIHLFYIT